MIHGLIWILICIVQVNVRNSSTKLENQTQYSKEWLRLKTIEMDHYYEMKNMLPQSHGYQPVENGHNADDRELKQVLLQAHAQHFF